MSNFWSMKSTEPKRKFRWLVTFNSMPQFIAKSVTKPSITVGNTEHNFLQHKFNFPGRVTWNDVSLVIVDPVQPDAAVSLYNIIAASGYVVPPEVMLGPEGMKTVSKERMVESIGSTITIDQIGKDGSDEILEQWTLHNPLITNVTFDGLDYTSDELLNITIGLKYDWATLNETAGPLPTTGWTS